MRESKIEKYLNTRVRDLGGEVRKIHFIGHRSAPDRLVMMPEVASRGPAGIIPAERFLVEVKAEGKTATAAQAREHNRLRKYGWRVEVVNSKAQVDALLW